MIQKPYNVYPRGGMAVPAEEDMTISWNVSGDIQVKYQVLIYDNSDDTLLHDSGEITSYSNAHIISGGIISNGNECKFKINIWNTSSDIASSDFEIFQTSSKPVVSLSISEVISSPNYLFEPSYSQAENVNLKSWRFIIYNENEVEIENSGIQTSQNFNYLINNLKSNYNYYVEVQVTSAKNITVTTGKIAFQVSYSSPEVALNLQANNHGKCGIKLTWDVIQIIGKIAEGSISYIDNDWIDLTNGQISFLDGFKIENDFILKIWLKNIPVETDFLKIVNEYGDISLNYYNNKIHAFKNLYMGGIIPHFASNTFDMTAGDTVFIFMQQINNLIELKAQII